jgi:hypothetical protein
MNEDLKKFVRESISAKLDRPQISGALERAGWSKDEVRSAMDAYADIDFPVPVPRRRPYLSAKEAFIYLLTFLCLYLSAWSFGSLVFEFIGRALPDATEYWRSANDTRLRMSLSMLVVAFPVYFLMTASENRAAKKDADRRASKIRKWLTYITLFVAAGVIIGDLIVLLNNFLGGELTLRFSLKVLTVLVIAAMIFGYYLWDLRKEEKQG